MDFRSSSLSSSCLDNRRSRWNIATMQARALHRIGVVVNGWRKPPAVVCLSISLLLPHAGRAIAEPSQNVVGAAEQSARDDERLRILRDELKKSEALVETLGRRKAERLAVSDITGADEAEEQRVRALSDVAGLKREIGAPRPSSAAPKAVTASPAPALPAKASSTKAQPSTPWWDVYGKANRGDKPAPLSFAKPSGATDAHLDPTRRLE
jgi:hypothetical protein